MDGFKGSGADWLESLKPYVTESHLRELLEQGFEVLVVKDATAAAQVPEGDGYQAALVNFRFLANSVLTTAETQVTITGTGYSSVAG